MPLWYRRKLPGQEGGVGGLELGSDTAMLGDLGPVSAFSGLFTIEGHNWFPGFISGPWWPHIESLFGIQIPPPPRASDIVTVTVTLLKGTEYFQNFPQAKKT